MGLKLVYRFLRKVSDWTLEGFYSEVYVEGQENVSRDQPLIIASTHHNEIIDIATLAATIPYRRHVSFWAKSSMFANPIARQVLSSSGAIPVHRNPNNGSSSPNGNSKASLFLASSKGLAKGDVIGVFPEGTSYTMPSIVQIMPGAAWAAVDFVRWARTEHIGNNKAKWLAIVPVGIIYTNKSQYLSRVVVRYGRPILVSRFVDEAAQASNDEETASRTAAENIMTEVETQLRAMTLNAPDWDTSYAAQTARDILWGDPESIPLKDWVVISQRLVETFKDHPNDSSLGVVVAALTKYHALLYFTGIEHRILSDLRPLNPPQRSLFQFFGYLPQALVSIAGTAVFIPTMLVYRPAYMIGLIASKLLVGKGEEESPAQYKAIFGGVGIGVGYGIWLTLLCRMGWSQKFWPMVMRAGAVRGAPADRLKRMVGAVAAAYGGLYFMVKWHNLFVKSNYRRLKKLLTLCKIHYGMRFCKPASPEELQNFVRPPPPPLNPFIRKRADEVAEKAATHDRATAPKPRFGSLICPLIEARQNAALALGQHLEASENRALKAFLISKGAKI